MSDSASAPSAEPLPGERPVLKLDVAVDKVSTCQRKVRVSIPRDDIDVQLSELQHAGATWAVFSQA